MAPCLGYGYVQPSAASEIECSPQRSLTIPGPESPTRVAGREGIKSYFSAYLQSFPDLRVTLKELLSKGDRVLAYVGVEGTHQGEFLGLKPTGRQTSTHWMMLFKLADGRITETWVASSPAKLAGATGD
jgi:predicted ester cyclase